MHRARGPTTSTGRPISGSSCAARPTSTWRPLPTRPPSTWISSTIDFYLFRDLASGEDALLERVDDGSYLLTRVRAAAVDAGPTAVALTVVDKPVPELDVTEAIGRISADGPRHVLFVNAATGRGNVIYHRYDGHYGLIAPD